MNNYKKFKLYNVLIFIYERSILLKRLERKDWRVEEPGPASPKGRASAFQSCDLSLTQQASRWDFFCVLANSISWILFCCRKRRMRHLLERNELVIILLCSWNEKQNSETYTATGSLNFPHCWIWYLKRLKI